MPHNKKQEPVKHEAVEPDFFTPTEDVTEPTEVDISEVLYAVELNKDGEDDG